MKISPGVPPSAVWLAMGEEPIQVGGLGGILLGQGAPKTFPGVPHWDIACPGGPVKNFPRVPPSDTRRARGGEPGRADGLGS